MDDAFLLEHPAEHFARLHRDGSHQDRSTLCVKLLQLLQHGIVLLAAGLVDRVVGVFADVRSVGRDGQHPQLVDVEKLLSFGLRSARHAGQLGVEPEVVLDGDRGECLGLALDLDVFLGLDGLVQTLTPTPAAHQTPRMLIDDDHLVVLNHILDIPLVKAVGLEQLAQRVDDSGLLLELCLQ